MDTEEILGIKVGEYVRAYGKHFKVIIPPKVLVEGDWPIVPVEDQDAPKGVRYLYSRDVTRVIDSMSDTGDYQLARLYCMGEGYDERYGWPIGDLVPEIMGDRLFERLQKLERLESVL